MLSRFRVVLLLLFVSSIALTCTNGYDQFDPRLEAGFPDFATKLHSVEIQKNATKYLVDQKFRMLLDFKQDEITSERLSHKCQGDLLATKIALEYKADFALKSKIYMERKEL